MQGKDRRTEEQGFSLITVLIGIGIVGILATAVTRLVDFGQKGSKSNELSYDRSILRHYLYQNLSCQHTVPQSPSPLCKGDPYVPIKDDNQANILKMNGPAGDKLGEWVIRARCMGSQQKILIEYSRRAADGSVLKDPLTGKLQDWSDLFPGYQLCRRSFSSSSLPVRTQTMDFKGSNGCDSGGLVGGVLDVKRRYSVTMSCAPGEKAVTGGAQCEHMKPGWTGPLGFKQAIIGKGSNLVASFPTPDGKSWYAECCVSTSGILGSLGSLLAITPQTFPIGFVRCESISPFE
jgi:hypothetical protein